VETQSQLWNLINNAWFIGIFGGLLSGLATTWIGRKLFSDKDKKEYLGKIETTNREIVYYLRSAISDNIHHDHKIINSLMAATARKNGVAISDIYSIKEVTEDLIKEVMDSSFIPSDYKKKYCEGLTQRYLSETPTESKEINFKRLQYTYRESSNLSTVTAMIGTMVAVSTFMLFALQDKTGIFSKIDSILPHQLKETNGDFLLVISPILAALVSMMGVFTMRYLITSKELRERKKTYNRLKENSLKEFKDINSIKDYERRYTKSNKDQ